MHLASVLAHQLTRVVGWRGNHRQHTSVARVDGHDTAYLALHESFAKGLEVHVDTQRQVLAGDRTLVELAILITALYSTMGIAKQYLDTLHATKLFLVRFLQSQLADVVAWLVVVIVLYVALRYLAHIAQYVGGIRIGILSHTSLLHIEARETEHLLLEHAEVLVGELRHEELLGVSRITRVLVAILDVVHSLDKPLLGDAQRVAEVHRIEASALLVHHHHDVVGRLVVYHQLAVPIVDGSTRRELYLLEEGVTVGVLLIVVAHNLKRKETNHVYDHNRYGHTTQYVSTLLKIVIQHTLLYITINS